MIVFGILCPAGRAEVGGCVRAGLAPVRQHRLNDLPGPGRHQVEPVRVGGHGQLIEVEGGLGRRAVLAERNDREQRGDARQVAGAATRGGQDT
jgi:hypothetical protein